MCLVVFRLGGVNMNNIKKISVHELHKKIGKVNIIEIRESCEVNGGKIPTSEIVLSIGIQMNADVFLNKNTLYYVACLSGYGNYRVVKMLQEKGYNVINIEGGTMEYKKYYDLEYIKNSNC